jgi:hypothetical protein
MKSPSKGKFRKKNPKKIAPKNVAPASVVVDNDFNILQFRGPTTLFLDHPSGQASFNIMKMAKEGLLGQLTAALIQAKREKTIVEKHDLEVRSNGRTRRFNLELQTIIEEQEATNEELRAANECVKSLCILASLR